MIYSFNLNNKIEAKLTEWGYIILFQYMNSSAAFVPNYKIKDISFFKEEAAKNRGYSTFQLWEFMAIFGKHMGNGIPNVCETDIKH